MVCFSMFFLVLIQTISLLFIKLYLLVLIVLKYLHKNKQIMNTLIKKLILINIKTSNNQIQPLFFQSQKRLQS